MIRLCEWLHSPWLAYRAARFVYDWLRQYEKGDWPMGCHFAISKSSWCWKVHCQNCKWSAPIIHNSFCPLLQPPIRHIAPRAAHLGPSGTAAHITLGRREGKMKKEGRGKKNPPCPSPVLVPSFLFSSVLSSGPFWSSPGLSPAADRSKVIPPCFVFHGWRNGPRGSVRGWSPLLVDLAHH